MNFEYNEPSVDEKDEDNSDSENHIDIDEDNSISVFNNLEI